MAEANSSPAGRFENAVLEGVEHWVFDLDNTLYSAQCQLFHQIDRRMGEYIAGLLGLAYEDARRLQKKYFHAYGTTLRGLMNHHQVEPSNYLQFVHDIDLSAIAPDQALDSALARLPGIKVIFTNANRAHAEQVIRLLGIGRHFAAIFDIQDADYVPKPEPETYDRLIARHGIAPERSVLFEDSAANLKPAAALGMTTVLVTPGEEGVVNDASGDHVHHVTDDLAGWLENAARGTAPGGGAPA